MAGISARQPPAPAAARAAHLATGRRCPDKLHHSEMPTNINRYLFRTPELTVASDDRDAFTYAKLGPFIILGFIAMAYPKQWVGTRVNTHGGTLGLSRSYTMPKQFWGFIADRANISAAVKQRISEKQTAKIAET
jgi:hypothetical protein